MDYSGFEKRRAQRADVRFLVSYAVEDPSNGSMRDLTQTRNISALGAMVTTDKPLTPATAVAMKIRLPSQPVPIALQGQVVESKEVTRNFIYYTRVKFLAVEEKDQDLISEAVDYFSHKPGPRHN